MRFLLHSLLFTLFTMTLPAAELRQATFAAGCFWCVEAIYDRVPGVTNVVSGYSGGKSLNPTYDAVGSGSTGHAEAVEFSYDPDKVTYRELLAIFWKSHDPVNGRGVAPDFGPAYRPILFYRTEEEKQIIEEEQAVLEKKLGKKVATEVLSFEKFWPAEEYHQDFEKKNPNHPYVRGVSVPRLKRTLDKE